MKYSAMSVGLAFAFSIFAAATTAHAQEPSAADKETARSLLNEGDAHFAKGEFPRALAAYRQADTLMHVPTTGVEVAKAEAASGLLVEAKATCLRVVNHPVSGAGEPSAFGAARRKCTEMTNALSARIPSVTFHLVGVRTGSADGDHASPLPSTVVLDGIEIPAEARRRLNPGPHTVTVTAAGYATFSKSFELHDGESGDVAIELKPSEATGAPATAPIAQTPASSSPSASPESPRVRAPVPMWAWIALGASGAGLTTFGITGAMSLGKLSDVEKQCKNDLCPRSAQSDLDGVRTLEMVANVALGVAIVGAAVATYGILTRGHVKSFAVSPSGAVLGGAF